MRALILASLLVATNAFAAARSVSLLGVSGVGGAHFAELLEQDLGDLYDLVPGEVYRRTAEKMDKRGASPEEVLAVSSYLRIDALVAGAITGEGRARKLVIVVREGASGRVVARGRYDLSGRTLPLLREKVMGDLVRALERVRNIPPRGQAVAQLPPPEGEEPEPEQPGEAEAVATVTRTATKSEQTWRGVIAGVGPALMTRSLGFDVASAPSYSGGTVAGIRADGAVFPLALSAELADAHPALASFGLMGSYQHVFNFTSSSAAGVSSEGHASRWFVLFVGRIPLGHQQRGGVLQLETGFQQLSWGSRSQQDLGVPDVNYDLVDLGMTWEKTLGTRYLVMNVRAAYQAFVDGGPIESDTQYGHATGWGLDLDVGLTAWPTRWLWIRLDARYTPIGLSFAQSGARFARTALDQFADGLLQVGFAL